MLAVVGVTAMEASVAAVIVMLAVPDRLPNAAVTVVEPGAELVVNPAVSTVAAAVLEVQVTVEVKSCVLPSV